MSDQIIHRIERFLLSSPQAVVWHISREYAYKELLSVCSYSLVENKIVTEHLLMDPVYFRQMLARHSNHYVTDELTDHLKKEFAPQFEDVVFNKLV